tara:strand:+ start:920 stop:1282 length:363 start_codon:yes stop_codon:yes gene_type:complete
MLYNVLYLEDEDFDGNNNLRPNVSRGLPTIVMAQGSFCGYCQKAKPAYQQLANNIKTVNVATLKIDGNPSEKKASSRLKQLDPSYRGVPTYLGFDKNGRYVKTHSGGRDYNSLLNFANSL